MSVRLSPVLRAQETYWSEEAHVDRARATYARKRARLVEAFEHAGIRVAGGTATMYVWVATPDGETSVSFADRLLTQGIVVAPGSYLGPSGEGYVRFALVPTADECARAAEIIENAL